MESKGFQQYKEQSVNTMTQGELLLLLYDELVMRLTRAGLALDQQNYPLMESSVEHSLRIIHYLEDTLDMQYEISSNLSKLYEFFCYELGRVKIGRNKEELDRIKRMVAELRDSFRTAQKDNDSGK